MFASNVSNEKSVRNYWVKGDVRRKSEIKTFQMNVLMEIQYIVLCNEESIK